MRRALIEAANSGRADLGEGPSAAVALDALETVEEHWMLENVCDCYQREAA